MKIARYQITVMMLLDDHAPHFIQIQRIMEKERSKSEAPMRVVIGRNSLCCRLSYFHATLKVTPHDILAAGDTINQTL